MLKKMVSLILCMTLSVAVLAGCSGGNESAGDGDNSENVENTQEEEVADDETAAEGEARTMTFLHWRTEDKAAFEHLARSYEEMNPGLSIEIEIVPTENYAETLIMRLQGGEAQDVFAVSPDGDFITEYQTGGLMELTDVDEVLSNFNEDALGAGTRDGVTYAVVQTTNPLAVYYNKDMFDEYDLDIPKTVEEFMVVCQTLQDNGITPMAQAGSESWFPEFMIELLLANCMEDTSLFSTGNITDDPGLVEAIEIAAGIYDSGYILEGSAGISEESLLTGFAVGNYAMIATGTWSMATIREINEEIDFGLFNMPGSKGTTAGVSNTGLQLAVSNETELKEDAIGFIAYLTSPEALTYFCNETGQLAVANDVEIESEDLLMAQELINGPDGMISAPFHLPNAEGLQVCWTRTVSLVIESVADPAAFAQEWEDELLKTME